MREALIENKVLIIAGQFALPTPLTFQPDPLPAFAFVHLHLPLPNCKHTYYQSILVCYSSVDSSQAAVTILSLIFPHWQDRYHFTFTSAGIDQQKVRTLFTFSCVFAWLIRSWLDFGGGGVHVV